MQWSVVWQEDASETEGKGLQNFGQTSRVVQIWATTRGHEMNTLEGQEKWRKTQASKKMTQNESSGM